ncbi:MAG: UDP-N-acetylmuramoyl-L-alanyl-D-glutamate--2,6-diaminopimelate ligase, partial [Candidatus Marinimicrobia bacterium]|nr:UDP-N-acetylmuramoyl-L-alanyl-D-glutamate--2,6-diaminopimelate ligase [Candidatus Neomarinimicrobiota bacterium]
QDHLDYHGDLERYFAAKALLFRGLGQKAKEAVAVINLDDAWGQRLLQIAAPRVGHVAYGFHPNALVRAADYRPTPTGSICAFETPWGDGQLELPLPGAFNVSNALAALATAGALGLDPVWAAAILAQMPPVPGRLEAIPHPGGPRVFVDYAHTPDALAQVLQTLRETTTGRLWVVFGCGGDRDRGKRPLMGALAAQYADQVVITSDNPRSEDPAQIAAEITAGLPPGVTAQCLLDRAVAIHQTLHAAAPADTILIAGKGHEAYQELADCVKPFDDREVARAVLNPTPN